MYRASRKPIRLPEYDYSQTGVYFITICTRDREPILSKIIIRDDGSAFPCLNPAGHIVEKYMSLLSVKYPTANIDRYIIMPDHVHLLLRLELSHSRVVEFSPTLGNILGWFKYQTTKEINAITEETGKHIWQRSYYDHIIRNDIDYLNIWQYIDENPLRWINRVQSIT